MSDSKRIEIPYCYSEEDGCILFKPKKERDNVRRHNTQKFCAIGYSFDNGDKNKLKQLGGKKPLPFSLLAQRWHLPNPKLLLRLRGNFQETVPNKMLLHTVEFLISMIKTAIQSETWILIECDLRKSFLREALSNAMKHVKMKELREIPVLTVCTMGENILVKDLSSSFVEGLDFYIFLPPDQATNTAKTSGDPEVNFPVIFLKFQEKDVDEPGDAENLRTLDIMQENYKENRTEETILRCLHAHYKQDDKSVRKYENATLEAYQTSKTVWLVVELREDVKLQEKDVRYEKLEESLHENKETLINGSMEIEEEESENQTLQEEADCVDASQVEAVEAENPLFHLETLLLIQCVLFNQLEVAVELFGLQRFMKEDEKSVATVAKEALRLKRYKFLQFLFQNGLDPCCLREEIPFLSKDTKTEDEAASAKKSCFGCKRNKVTTERQRQVTQSKKRMKIDHLIKTLCNLKDDEKDKKESKKDESESPKKENVIYISMPQVFNKSNDTDDNAELKKDVNLAHLFKDTVLVEDFQLSFLLLQTINFPTGAALYAYGMLKAMRQAATSDEERLRITSQMREFEKEAVNTINKTYHDYPEEALHLLGQCLPSWGNMTCILLALRTGNKKFLASPPCKEFQKRMWRSGSLLEKDFQICSTCCYKAHKEADMISAPEEIRDHESKVPLKQKKLKKKLRVLLSPAVLVVLKFTSHFLFLILYAMLLVSVLKTEFHWLEWVIWSWIVTGIAEQINQCRRNPLNRLNETHQLRVFDWIESFSLLLFVITWFFPRLIAYFYPHNADWMTWARVLFSIDYIGFALGLLEACYVHQFLGPILLMIMRMTKTLLQFIIIVLILCLAYAVASESVLYPTAQMNPKLAFYVMRKSFWAMFAEFNLDEINGESCTNNSDSFRTYEQLRCPTNAGKYYVPPLMGVYYIIVNILLFNLLIAMFNSKIAEVGKKSEEVWHHQKMQLTWKYCKVIFLPPPFIILSPFLWKCRAIKKMSPFKQGNKSFDPLRLQRLQMVASKSNKESETPQPVAPLSQVYCNGVILCSHMADSDGKSNNESKRPSTNKIMPDPEPKNPISSEKLASIKKDTHQIKATTETDSKETQTDSEFLSSPPEEKINVVTEERIFHSFNRRFQDTSQVKTGKKRRRSKSLSESRYMAVREPHKNGTRWRVLTVEERNKKDLL